MTKNWDSPIYDEVDNTVMGDVILSVGKMLIANVAKYINSFFNSTFQCSSINNNLMKSFK